MTLDELFESIQNYFDDALPFVAYRNPNSDKLKALFQEDDTLYKTSDFTESGFVFAPFDDHQKAVLIPANVSESLSINFVMSSAVESSQATSFHDITGKTEHINLVQKGIDAINNKQFEKVVLSRVETIPVSNSNFVEVFKRLLNTYTTAFVYCWCHPKIGLWLGATPETLLQIEGNRLSTMALAGTQKYNGTVDVVWKEKEKQEQQIVTDFVVESLKTSIESINVTEATTVKAGNLLHLQTKITAFYNSEAFKLNQIIKALHPTPAVCGYPKANAKQFILENENYNRTFYTGFLGELNIKETSKRNTNRRNVENNAYNYIKTVSNLFVNLRSMEFKETEALIYVGGGITKDSNPTAEWEETVNKTQTIKNSL